MLLIISFPLSSFGSFFAVREIRKCVYDATVLRSSVWRRSLKNVFPISLKHDMLTIYELNDETKIARVREIFRSEYPATSETTIRT